MRELDNLLNICNQYKQGKFDIEEFQSRISTAFIHENLSKEFLEFLVDFDNELERIIFCSAPILREEQGYIIADKLIKAILAEQKK